MIKRREYKQEGNKKPSQIFEWKHFTPSNVVTSVFSFKLTQCGSFTYLLLWDDLMFLAEMMLRDRGRPVCTSYKKWLKEAMTEVEEYIALFEEYTYIYVGREITSKQDEKIQPISKMVGRQQSQQTPLPPIRPKMQNLRPTPPGSESTKKPTARPFRMIRAPPLPRKANQPTPALPAVITQRGLVPLPPICKKVKYTSQPPLKTPKKPNVTRTNQLHLISLSPISIKKL